MKIALTTLICFLVLAGILGAIWTANLGGIKENIYVNQIVKMRVAPKRLENVKNPSDYGMEYVDVKIPTDDGLELSAWEIPAPTQSNKTIIVNHPLTTTRYGSVEGLDGVPVEFLPMVKHLHDAGYNIITYDHRGQGDSEGGVGKTMKGKEAPVGAGETEWKDVVASLKYVQNHPEYSQSEISFLSQCMGANATFLAWRNEPELFSSPQIKSLVAIQPTISYNMVDRMIRAKTKMNLVDRVQDTQREEYGFGYANALANVPSLTVPVLYAQVEKDEYTFNKDTGKNDLQEIADATPTDHEIIWIGPDQAKPFGTGKRFDGYGYFNEYPEELLAFLDANF